MFVIYNIVMKTKIFIKPLSVNRCWQGRRFKTSYYESYEQELLLRLPRQSIDPSADLTLEIIVGYSSMLSDVDNSLKPLIDILQKKYLFNDRNIRRIVIEKVKTEKGQEFIEFEIREY